MADVSMDKMDELKGIGVNKPLKIQRQIGPNELAGW